MSAQTVMAVLSLCLTLLTALCYCYQVFYLILSLFPRSIAHRPPRATRYGILIAARNEEAVLPHLLESIRAQDYPAALISTYVVADNCTDRTAQLARRHGARVVTRFDRNHVGKGYALNYLLETLRHTGELDLCDAFLIFDADNLLAPDYITQINRLCSDGYAAFCGYRNAKNFGANWLSSGYGLWYLHDCGHLNRARMSLGLCCYASGTGFGFTRELLETMGGWNFLTLTEDTEFRTWCATHGIPIGYCHDAILYDEQPTSIRVSFRQRTRWVQGNIQVSLRCAGDYLRGMAKGGRTAWCSFEAATLSLWGCCVSAAGLLCRFLSAFLSGGWSALLFAILTALVCSYAAMFCIGVLTLITEGSRIRATPAQKFRAVLAFPLYILSYIPIVLTAPFRKFRWHPIAHTCAISAGQLGKP